MDSFVALLAGSGEVDVKTAVAAFNARRDAMVVEYALTKRLKNMQKRKVR